jgi:putative tricarboxylic transport membrane protein
VQDRILGAIAVLVAIAMAVGARDYVAPIAYEPIGPRAVPTLLAVLIGLVGLWLLLRPSSPGASAAAQPQQADQAGGDALASALSAPHGSAPSPILPLRVVLATLAIVVYALLFELLGFTLATALMTVPIARLFGGSWKQGAVTGVAMGFILFLVFDRLLGVVLPAGLLKGLL